jgi:hypothetical protein
LGCLIQKAPEENPSRKNYEAKKLFCRRNFGVGHFDKRTTGENLRGGGSTGPSDCADVVGDFF